MTAARLRALRPDRWVLSSAPRGVLPSYLAVEALAVVLVLLFPGPVPDLVDWQRFCALLVAAILQAELSLGTEKQRRYLADGPHINMTSVWMFGGAVVLPAWLAVTLTVVIYLHLWIRVWRSVQRRTAYRVLFSATTMVLACLSVQPVLRLFGTAGDDWLVLLAMVVAGLVFTSINGLLVGAGIRLHHPSRPWSSVFGSKAENALELATLSLGGATAVVLVNQPALVALMLLPVIVLHRNVLLRQLEEKASQDSKTGLLTAEEWRSRVAGELLRRRRPFCVLIIDLDRFKRVNDTYGHVAGDAVLRAVADTIRVELRAYDAVGRWGGEEFAVLLPDLTEDLAIDVAERIRQAVAALTPTVVIGDRRQVIGGLSASVGVAGHPRAADTVEGLVHAADTAMYQAKRNGRNTVVNHADLEPAS